MSLPPELGEIDDAWGDDEQPTIARPSRIPTSPARISIPSEAPTAPGFDSRAFDHGESEDDKITTIPEIPLDEFARSAMRSDKSQHEVTEAPAPPVLDLEFELDPPPVISSPDPRPSKMPTAPPPLSFGEQRAASRRDASRNRTLEGFGVEPNGPTHRPPTADVRTEGPAFSGRFSSAPPGEQSIEARMKGKFAMGDFSGALEVAESILDKHPNNDEAKNVARKCREVLQDMYSSRIAGLHRVPRVVMSSDQIRWLSLDHRAGFVLSMIDGISSVDDLLDVSGMPRLDALRILCELLDAKVILLS